MAKKGKEYRIEVGSIVAMIRNPTGLEILILIIILGFLSALSLYLGREEIAQLIIAGLVGFLGVNTLKNAKKY